MAPTDLSDHARNAVYVAVGLGVIAARNVDDAVRQLLDTLEQRAGQGRDRFGDLDRFTAAVDALNERLDQRTQLLEDRVAELEDRIDTVLDRVEDTLPDTAADVLAQARGAARDARGQLRSLVGRAA